MGAEKGKLTTGIAVYCALPWTRDSLRPMTNVADPTGDSEGLALELLKGRSHARGSEELVSDFWRRQNECYVYITLTGTAVFVTTTAGRFVHEADCTGVPVGRFVHGKNCPANPDVVPIDPLELTPGTTTYRTTKLDGVFGAFCGS